MAIDQCDFGHPCRKPTWLYVVGVDEADLPSRPPPGEPTHVMVRLESNGNDLPELPKGQRHLTPPAFADWLVELARRADKGHRVSVCRAPTVGEFERMLRDTLGD